jgi:hypothetical protein
MLRKQQGIVEDIAKLLKRRIRENELRKKSSLNGFFS